MASNAPPSSSHPNTEVIRKLYAALGRKNGKATAACYAPDAHFKDIAFDLKSRDEIVAMCRLACSGNLTVDVKQDEISADDRVGHGRWIASYTFKLTRRPVVSDLRSEFTFREPGLIATHVDSMDPKEWASDAFPPPIDRLFGSSEWLQRKLARRKLDKFIRDNP